MTINTDVPEPNSIQVEPAEGCTLACSFCGIQAIRDNGADRKSGTHGRNSAPFRFMTIEVAERLASQIAAAGWTSRIEFAMHGEPTANRILPEIVGVFRDWLPKNSLMVTSNGSGFVASSPLDTVNRMDRLFNAGLNTLVLDDYKHGFLDRFRETLSLLPWDTYEYPGSDASPHERFHGMRVIIIHDISENTAGTHTLTNQGGASGGPSKTIQARCAKPFRELSVRWDGNVAICCDDWTGRYKVGNIMDIDLPSLWWSPQFEAARRMLFLGDRRFGPCAGCDVRTYRNGLLPDRKGKKTMLAPDAESMQVIKASLQGLPFSSKLAPSKV